MENTAIETAAAAIAPASFTVPAASLQAAAKFLAGKIVRRRNTVPVLACLHVAASPQGTVTLSGTDLYTGASVALAADVEAPGEFLVDAKVFADAVAKARKGKAADFALSVTGNEGGEGAAVKAGRTRINVACPFGAKGGESVLDSWPANAPIGETQPDPVHAFAMPAAQLVGDLAALSPCMSTEEARYYLRGVALELHEMAGRERLVFIATDGSNMAVASRDVPEGAEGLANVIVPRDAVAAIVAGAKLADGAESCRVAIGDKGRLGFALGNVTVTAKAVEGTFPANWRTAFETHSPSGEGEAPLFPDLLPGSPLRTVEAIGRAAPATLSWEYGASASLATVEGDPDLAWLCMHVASGGCGKNGFEYRETGHAERRAYLIALAESLGLPSPDAVKAQCEAFNEKQGERSDAQYNREAPYSKAFFDGVRVTADGLSVESRLVHYPWTEMVTDWETLSERAVDHEQVTEPFHAYSIPMPADAPAIEPESYVDGPDGHRYPVADNEKAIHLSAAQLRALIGESCFDTMEFPGPDGKPRFVCRWLWDDGASRLLVVGKDGRAPKDEAAPREYVTRAEIEAALAGEAMREPVAEPCAAQCPAEPVKLLPPPSACAAPVEAVEPPAEAEPGDPLADVLARLEAVEARLATLSVEPDETQSVGIQDMPAPSERPKRTPAHERAVRRAWAERRARREAARDLVKAREAADRYWQRAETAHDIAREFAGKRRRAVLLAHRHWTMRLVGRHQRRQLEADFTAMEKGRRAVARIGRDLALKARCERERQRQRADRAEAELARLRTDMADPSQPERASDIARLVRERDEARTANAALQDRCKRAEEMRDTLAGVTDSMASRIAQAEAKLRALDKAA